MLSTLAGFGPLAVGGALSWRDGNVRSWARQALRWRTEIQWWAVALFVAPVLSLIGYGSYLAVTETSFGLTDDPIVILYLMLFFYILLLRGGFGEEMGWRGYALPLLLKQYNTTIAALLIGVGWAAWHLPLFFIQGTRQSGSFTLYLVGVVGLSIILAWLYTRSRGSVLLTTVFHAQWNVFDSGALFATSGEAPLVAPGASALVIWLFAGILIVADSETMRSEHPGLNPFAETATDE
ncbi:CPBP family intramembrane glutamic endopeptidase [Halobellus rarus]|uniref:CPBP family intramembrane glutamic endopeptidase n=1 Tax=Halobellus rarus TaxID=1126237 RepID=A0ABD6CT77_9EURY|nr:CPBP family intramembrane glutamic endopeptidase [Halobellus rarus]